jgi:hypothetical protein
MTDKVYTTLKQIRDCSPCEDGYKKLVKSLGGLSAYGEDTPVSFKQIYDSNGHDDTLWCLRTTAPETHNLWRHFAVDAAEMVEHLMTDERSKNALRVARNHADGKATDDELAAAWAAARDAAGDATWAAAWAAASAAARDAARDAAWDAQITLLMEYCRTGERVDWRKFLGGNPLNKAA